MNLEYSHNYSDDESYKQEPQVKLDAKICVKLAIKNKKSFPD